MSNFLQLEFLMNSGKEWLIALGILIGSYIVLRIIKQVLFSSFKRLSEKTENDLDDFLLRLFGRLNGTFIFFVSLYLATRSLVVTDLVQNILDGLFTLVLVVYSVFLIQETLTYVTTKYLNKKDGEDSADPTAIKTINSFLKVVVWIIAAVMLLSNWGVNVSGLIAGLGIGGIAIAFAFQNILEDVFSSFSILIDKPFRVGDFILVGSESGTVKYVGIKTTRIETLQGEELVMSNRKLTGADLHNFGKLKRRRNLFSIGVTYETPSDKFRKVPDLVKSAIESVENVTFDRVHFRDFGDSSLDFEIVYYAESDVYAEYMDIQQAVKMAIKENLDKEEIEFAYPTRTIFNKK